MTTFGRSIRPEWPLDPAITYLNHGTVGVAPLRVLAAQQAIRDEIECGPAQLLLRELAKIAVGVPRREPPRLRVAAEAVARFLGAQGEDLVFVDNTTTGANAVLQSVALRPGDEILIPDLAYGGIVFAAQYHARRAGAVVRRVEMPEPASGDAELVAAIDGALSPRTRLAIVDHITSETALLMPVREIAAACRARGVAVLVDGAHAPGAIPVDIPSLGVDWYVANLHKWAWVPRSSGILWTAKERQSELHPTVVSWGLDQGMTTEFDWLGTRDPSAHLAAPAALAYLEELGVAAVQGYDHDLAWRGAHLLARAWDVPLATPEARIGTMATVALPEAAGSTPDQAARLRDALLFEDRIEVQLHAWRERLWVRVSAQIYNELGDFERLAEAVRRRAK